MKNYLRDEYKPLVSRLAIFAFCVLVAAWVTVYALVVPPSGGVDVFIFKEVGSNLALGKRLTSIPVPLFDGYSILRVYSSYTPFYPLLYGMWGLMFGVGAFSSAYFDLLVAILASCLTLKLLMPALEQRRDQLLSVLIIGIALSAGSVFTNRSPRDTRLHVQHCGIYSVAKG